ncbi:MAG: class I SAM-dependent methyltransferase, partial [Pseudomonadota bacterium]
MNCRSCASSKMHSFLDLGFAPPSNAYLSANDLSHSETHFPLRVAVCEECWLVQAEQYTDVGDLFDADYAYFSSTSQSWLEHANRYASKMIAGLGLGKSSFVVELASNDGYLLRNFVEREVPCLGVEPTLSTATAARTIGVSTLQEFFGVATAQKILDSHGPADLICGNNVYAHVPDIHGFTRGVQRLLKPEGIVTFEFPHLLNLLQYNQFDTVYHEHFSYFSLLAVLPIFKNAKLRVFKVEKLSTHGGSLRIYGCHQGSTRESDPSLSEALAEERQYGLDTLAAYAGVQSRADALKDSFLY